MARYVVSDHHFGHANIIEYCDRPFSSVGEMNAALLDRHYETVDDGDVLVHLGDVAMDMRNGTETVDYFERLDGDVPIRGNHDVGLDPDDAPFPVLDSCVVEHGEYRFYKMSRRTPRGLTPRQFTVRTARGTSRRSGTDGCSTATTTTTTPTSTRSWRVTSDGST